MITLRLQRTGRKNDAHFRLVATDSKNAAKSGKFLEVLGSFNVKLGTFEAKADRVKHWLSVGAQPSVTAYNLLIDKKFVEGKKKSALPKKTMVKKEGKKK